VRNAKSGTTTARSMAARPAGQSARKNNGRQTLKTKIINLIRLLLGIHGPVQLRNAYAPADWSQTVAEQIDREQPWLKYRRV